jgi:hypothetical protein
MEQNCSAEPRNDAFLIPQVKNAAYSAKAGNHVLVRAAAQSHNHFHLRVDWWCTSRLNECPGLRHISGYAFSCATAPIGRFPLKPCISREHEPRATSSLPGRFPALRGLSIDCHVCFNLGPTAGANKRADTSLQLFSFTGKSMRWSGWSKVWASGRRASIGRSCNVLLPCSRALLAG